MLKSVEDALLGTFFQYDSAVELLIRRVARYQVGRHGFPLRLL